MNWISLNEEGQLDAIKEKSQQQPVLIFKHSTRCSISAAALNRLERSWKEEDLSDLAPYYLDLINHRNISNRIASDFQVIHESPQALLIHKGNVIYHASHMSISYQDLKEEARKAKG